LPNATHSFFAGNFLITEKQQNRQYRKHINAIFPSLAYLRQRSSNHAGTAWADRFSQGVELNVPTTSYPADQAKLHA